VAGTGGAYDRGHPSSDNLVAHCAAQLLAVHLVRQYTCSTVGRCGARAACPAPPGLRERQIQQVLAFIRTQLGEQLSLAVLAQQIGYSSYHFARLLRRTLGASPH
jgi:AraC family transcriptional regulator